MSSWEVTQDNMEVTQVQREMAAGIDMILDRRKKNTLPLYGNKETMNLNSMILTNVQGSPYFKEDLYEFKTFHEVVDEVFYKVSHMEPWERNSRKLAGQVGMCGGVRGVAAGGIVSTAFCLLYKLFTLKLTRRQLTSLINHRDSPYIRALGFLYIRYCQPPADFWDWMGPYLDDEEEIDLKAGGGYQVTIGEMVRMILCKLEWFGTLFPRIPLNVQKQLQDTIKQAMLEARQNQYPVEPEDQVVGDEQGNGNFPVDEWGEAGRRAMEDAGNSGSKRSRSRERRRSRSRSPRRRSRERDRRERDRSRERRGQSRERYERRGKSRERSRERKGRSRSPEQKRRSSRERRGRSRERSRERKGRSRSPEQKRRLSPEQKRRSSPERRGRSRERSRERRGRSRSREQRRRSKDRSREKERRERKRSGSRERARESSRSRNRSRDRDRSRERVRR